MIYGLFSQGFRVGGLNSLRAASSGLVPLLYNGDFLNNYEFGVKSMFADGRVSLNASAFFMQWDDYQQGVAGDAWWNGGTINAGEAEVLGLEATMRWQMTDRLSFNASVSFSDNKFQDDFCTNFVDNVNLGCEPGIEPRIVAGMTMPNAPKSKVWASIYYEIPDVLGGELWFYFDYSYQAESWSGIDEIKNNDLDGLARARNYSSFSTGLQLPNQFDVILNVTNLFDSNGYTYVWTGEGGSADTFGSDRYQQQRAQDRPRTVWLTLKKGFGGT